MRKLKIFKTRWFERFAIKEHIQDSVLLAAIARAEKGSIDADLGGGVIKQRIARPGRGKSGGYRAVIVFRAEDRAVFMYGFAKSSKDNIRADEEKAFKDAAKHLLALTDKVLAELVKRGDFVEGESEEAMSKTYQSEAMAAIHETMESLHKAGAVDKRTMRRFDKTCLTPIQSLTAKQIKGIRERERVSQTVFASYLNVTPNLVSKWERGEKRPSGPALKLLSLVKKHGLSAVA